MDFKELIEEIKKLGAVLEWTQKKCSELEEENLQLKREINNCKLNKDNETIDVPDIRNKLSPVTHLVSMYEAGHMNYVDEVMPKVKKSINYLAQREVYNL